MFSLWSATILRTCSSLSSCSVEHIEAVRSMSCPSLSTKKLPLPLEFTEFRASAHFSISPGRWSPKTVDKHKRLSWLRLTLWGDNWKGELGALSAVRRDSTAVNRGIEAGFSGLAPFFLPFLPIIGMEAGNSLCKECAVNEAEIFCTCTDPESCFCQACFFKHSSQVSRAGHTTWPMQYLACYKNPHFFDRKEALAKVRAQAFASVTDVEKAIAELQELVWTWQAQLDGLRSVKEQLSRDILEAVAEVERTLLEDHPRLFTVYGPVLRCLTAQPQPFQLLEISLRIANPVDLVVRLKATEEIVAREQFPVVWGNTLTLYDIHAHTASQMNLAVCFSDGTSYIDLDPSTLLCLGGYPACTDVYSLLLHCAQLSECASLTVPKCAPGSARWSSCVYAFGGVDSTGGLTTSSEKWQVNTERWIEIQPMRYPRAYFTPCRYNALFYLLAAKSKDHRAIETFNPVTEAFLVLAVSLPSQLRLSAGCVVFASAGELCMLTHKKQLVRWEVAAGNFRLSEVARRCWATQPSWVVGKEVLIAHMGRVVKLSLESFNFLSP